MTLKRMKRMCYILDMHGIGYCIESDRIFADDEYVTRDGVYHVDKKDVTEFSWQDLRDWLGY